MCKIDKELTPWRGWRKVQGRSSILKIKIHTARNKLSKYSKRVARFNSEVRLKTELKSKALRTKWDIKAK